MRYFLYKTLHTSNIIHTFATVILRENINNTKNRNYERSKGIRRFKKKIP